MAAKFGRSSSRICLKYLKSRISNLSCQNRTFLSEAFECKAAWNERLTAPIFSKIDMRKYFLDLDRKYHQDGFNSPVDVEIFTNGLLMSEDGQISSSQEKTSRLEELEELLRRFRRTPQTVSMMESTHHAVVRGFVEAGDTDTLMRILNNRITFGIFPDDYTMVYLLDHFAKRENWRDMAKCGILMMLQEEVDIPLARELAAYGCYKYAKVMHGDDNWDPQPSAPAEEPEDEVKVWVGTVDNPDFDGHFDLVSREQTVGKSLAAFGRHFAAGQSDEARIVADSLKLVGNAAYGEDLVEPEKPAKFAAESVRLAKMLAGEDFRVDGEVVELDVEAFLSSRVEAAAKSDEESYVRSQLENFKRWNVERDEELDRQYKLLRQSALRQGHEQARARLREDEEKLFFFDNYERMEKLKRAKFAAWRGTWPRKTWSKGAIKLPPRDDVKETYIPPPAIVARRK